MAATVCLFVVLLLCLLYFFYFFKLHTYLTSKGIAWLSAFIIVSRFSSAVVSHCCVDVVKSACEMWCMLCLVPLRGNVYCSGSSLRLS